MWLGTARGHGDLEVVAWGRRLKAARPGRGGRSRCSRVSGVRALQRVKVVPPRWCRVGEAWCSSPGNSNAVEIRRPWLVQREIDEDQQRRGTVVV